MTTSDRAKLADRRRALVSGAAGVFVVVLLAPLAVRTAQLILAWASGSGADLTVALWAALPRAALQAAGPALLGAVLHRLVLRRWSWFGTAGVFAGLLMLGELLWVLTWNAVLSHVAGPVEWRSWAPAAMLVTPYAMIGAGTLFLWRRARRAGAAPDPMRTSVRDPASGHLHRPWARTAKLGVCILAVSASAWGVMGFYLAGTQGVVDAGVEGRGRHALPAFIQHGVVGVPGWMAAGAVVGLLSVSFYAPMMYRRCAERGALHTLAAMLVLSNALGGLVAVATLALDAEPVVLGLLGVTATLLMIGAGPISAAYACARVPSTWTRYPPGFCLSCGYDRSGLGHDEVCPECGLPFGPRGEPEA